MLRTSEIHIRDPFVLVHGGKYYLYGSRGDETWGHCTGLDVYVGTDLENWEGPINCFTPPEGFWSDFNFWAPEVHFVNGKFRMFVSFKSETRHRGTQILVSDTPTGNFVPMQYGSTGNGTIRISVITTAISIASPRMPGNIRTE